MTADEKLNSIFSNFEGKGNELIPILQKVQGEFGYLPEDAMLQIAKFTRVPESQVFAVATFYSQFRFTPIGRQHIMVCRGTACHVKGAPRILDEIETQLGIKEGETTEDLEYSLESVACIGACGLSPCIMVNKKVEAKLTPKKIKKIFGKGDKK
jgi:NADH-quinone oxidoreductase subunit E